MSNIVYATDASFEADVLKAEVPVLVDFWAEWCSACKIFEPTLKKVEEENENIIIAKVNVDENGVIAQKYGIRSIPTLLIFKNGEFVNKVVGAISKAQLMDKINEDFKES